jgi:polyhydroxyalkanoate synthesis regulator phasin
MAPRGTGEWRSGCSPRELTAINPAYKTLATGAPEPVVIWDKSFRGKGLNGWAAFHRLAPYLPLCLSVVTIFLVLAAVAIPAHGREKDVLQYGAGLIVNVPVPEPEVAQVVEDVAQNTIIRGTKEYNKDEYVAGAIAATSTPVFPAWTEGGKVFYKVRKQALDPRNFKDSGDVGTLAVRYVVQPQGDKNTVLRIDALFVEDFRHSVHQSNGSVESSEYKDIQDRLAAVELMKKENAEAEQAKQERLAKQNFGMGNDTVLLSTPPSTAKSTESTNGEAAATSAPQSPPMPQPSAVHEQPAESLEQHVAELRRQVERLVKQPGAPLKSAPFHTASTLKSLEPGVEVLILISTPYWYGIETRDGQHGWIRRDQLEQAP